MRDGAGAGKHGHMIIEERAVATAERSDRATSEKWTKLLTEGHPEPAGPCVPDPFDLNFPGAC